jgi:uncharacterized LabA/DUF88 family protein
MPIKVAILIDGEWFRIALLEKLRSKLPDEVTAEVVYKNAKLALEKGESLIRIFYYDSEPHEGNTRNPISKKTVPCISPEKIAARRRFFAELGQMPFIALRRGIVKPRGWVLRMSYFRKLTESGGKVPILTADDMRLSLTQKGVDMRIGIDVATLSLKKQVDRIILISGDLDMIPAMKLARREGVQVAIVQIVGKKISSELVEDSDLVRQIKLTV